MKYYVVVQAPAYSLTAEKCAMESAFAVHLRMLRLIIGPKYEELVLIAPGLPEAAYRASAGKLEVLELQTSGVRFLPAFPLDMSRGAFLLQRLWPIWRWLSALFREPCVVQSGMSTELGRPLMFLASLAARRFGRPVIFIVDMDFRLHARSFYRAGHWSLKSYLVNRFAYDPLKWLQMRLAPLLFAVCCFKDAAMVRDFGRGRANVHMFYDTVHSLQNVLAGGQLARRLEWIAGSGPMVLVYFGRLAANKGVDRMITAVGIARAQGVDARLRIIGDGDRRSALVDQVHALGLEGHVEFVPQVAYGEPLFRLLEDCHACVAAPLIEDTPRAAFDAFSRGLPVIAFDIAYFRDLAQASGAVITTPLSQATGLAEAVVQLAQDRQRLAQLAQRAVQFAADNTQEIWLRRRLAWLDEVSTGSPQ
jgi:glycosyltransferase involved in cell wall biosynthesis